MSSPFPRSETGTIFRRYVWPVSWISHPETTNPPFVLGFRLMVDQAQDATVRFHVSADERYELHFDGELFARGPERGSPGAWNYSSLDVPVAAGRHVLFARVWSLGEIAPCAQMSVRPGFLLGVEESSEGGADARWSTGLAPWEVRRLDGYEWTNHALDFFTGKKLRIDGRRYPWGIERGEGDGWIKAVVNAQAFTAHPTDLYPPRLLVAGTLPAMLRRSVPPGKVRFLEDISRVGDISEHPIHFQNHLSGMAEQLQALLEGRSTLTIPAGKRYRAIVDLQNYFCAYPRVQGSRGRDAELTIRWAEALFAPAARGTLPVEKGNRNEIEGRIFIGLGDSWIFDGEMNRDYSTLWWEAGRYLEVLIETRSEELVLDKLTFEETRYPLEMESSFSANDKRMEETIPLLLRSLQMNTHETFMDCPYYEQLNYAGDTLIDCLVFYTITHDDRMVRKSLRLFNDSRFPEGLTLSRFPSRIRQVIPPFSLLWISMLRHHAWWRGDVEFVRSLLRGTRAVIDAHLAHVNSDGLLTGLRGWNFLDWVIEWKDGIPPHGDVGEISGPLNWLFVYVLQAAVELETYAGEPELASRYARLAEAHARATEAAFWNEEKGLFADDPDHQFYSEHAQCLAILSGKLRESVAARVGQGLLDAPDLRRCTIYFSHYLFETFHKLNRFEPLFARLEHWYGLTAQGFVTTPEMPEPTRSDCHAWGSHPLFHYYATILGIRPAAMGFQQVEIRPQLGPLLTVTGRVVHPQGWIEVDLRRSGDRLEGTITLPDGVTGTFHGARGSQLLTSGAQKVSA